MLEARALLVVAAYHGLRATVVHGESERRDRLAQSSCAPRSQMAESRDRSRCSAEFMLDGCEQARRQMVPAAIVGDFELREARVREIDARFVARSSE
jgi:hypothetical protein